MPLRDLPFVSIPNDPFDWFVAAIPVPALKLLPVCSLPFSRMCWTTSVSTCVPKSFSSCCRDGVESLPWLPWFDQRTWKAIAKYDQRERARIMMV